MGWPDGQFIANSHNPCILSGMPDQRQDASRTRRLDPVLDFLRSLWALNNRLQSTSKRMETVLGITGPQRFVLRIVGRFPGVSPGELAHIVQLHPSTITGILQRLARRRLLIRERDPYDKRRQRLRLSDEGKPFARFAQGTVESAVRRTLAKVSARDMRRVREVLSALEEALDDQL